MLQRDWGAGCWRKENCTKWDSQCWGCKLLGAWGRGGSGTMFVPHNHSFHSWLFPQVTGLYFHCHPCSTAQGLSRSSRCVPGLSKTVLGMVPRVHLKKVQDKKGIVINVWRACANSATCSGLQTCQRTAWHKSKCKLKASWVIDAKNSHHEGSAK